MFLTMNNSKPGVIFRLRYALSDGTRLYIQAEHTGRYESRGTSIITIQAIHTGLRPLIDGWNKFRCILWKSGETWCSPSPLHEDDSDAVKALVTSLVSIKPGDTDSDYFAHHTPEQLAFCERYGEELSMLSEERYGQQ